MAIEGKPTLWHLPYSHYSEKVRWALAHKGVEHRRRALGPPAHMATALVLTRGRHKTLPVLQLDGEAIGDSSAIVAALERRFPDPPLYPESDDERRRALELEEWFDEELGPQIRLLAMHEITRDQTRLEALTAGDAPRPLRRLAAGGARSFLNLRFGVESTQAAQKARERVRSALDRLERELDGGEYLVAGRFTVADLTAAALFYLLVLPPEGPRLPELPEALERFRAPLKERPGYRWVEEMFRRHRPSAES